MLPAPGRILGRWTRFFGALLINKHDNVRLDIIKRFPQMSIRHTLGAELIVSKVTAALRPMANAKAVGSDELLVKPLKLELNHDPTVLRYFHRIIKMLWHQRKVQQQLRDAKITILHKTKDRPECGNYRGISLVAHEGKVLLKVIATSFSTYCEAKGLLPAEQCGFRLHRSTTGMISVMCRLQGLERKARAPLFLYLIDLQEAYDFVDRTLSLQTVAHFEVQPQIIEVIHQSQDGMSACVQNNDGVCSEWFQMAQGLRQGRVLSPLLFNIFFAAIPLVALERFSVDTDILADLTYLQEQPSKVAPETTLECARRAIWGMLYVGNACIVSRSPRGLETMMAVFVAVFRAFSLTISR